MFVSLIAHARIYSLMLELYVSDSSRRMQSYNVSANNYLARSTVVTLFASKHNWFALLQFRRWKQTYRLIGLHKMTNGGNVTLLNYKKNHRFWQHSRLLQGWSLLAQITTVYLYWSVLLRKSHVWPCVSLLIDNHRNRKGSNIWCHQRKVLQQ